MITNRTPESLRDWLEHLRRRDRLKIPPAEVPLEFGVAGYANRLDGWSACLFPRPGGHSVPIVTGLLSDRRWMAEAVGVDSSKLLSAFERACRNPLPWSEQHTGDCQEVVHDEVDLLRLLPIPTHNELDSGPYITAGLLISREQGTGRQNVSIHRLQISGKDRMGVLLLPRHTLAFQAEAERAGEDLEIAVVIGVDPLTLMASQAIVPLGQDELEIAGALHGEPLPVVKCTTNDVRVPASAEIVIEGRLVSAAREEEGPFGEFPQYYGERDERHVVEVDAVTTRKRPIFHTIVGGALEHLLLGAIPREASFLSQLRSLFPCVKDVHLSLGGVGRYHLYVQVENAHPGEAKNVILGAFACHYDIKHVYVVDVDVDVHDPREVEWAVATRFQSDRDLVTVSSSQGSKLDPSTESGMGAKLGFDATVPYDATPGTFTRIRVPGEDEIDIETTVLPAPENWFEAVHR